MKFLPALLAALSLCAAQANADERILSFRSDITIAPDAGMDVVETIRVRAEGDAIRHGIYRDFPTDYRDRGGNRVHVAFEPLSVTRDGAREGYHTEAQTNGTRVYFGSEQVTLPAGEYTYTFRYRTARQLGFFADHDELYWNVTGNGWAFPIDAAEAQVTLPGAIDPARITIEGYTGAQGGKGQDYVATVDAASSASIRSTRTLAPQEGLTVVVGFPKGVVPEPTSAERARWFVQDNKGALVAGIGLFVLWLYFLVQWLRIGRDPPAGVVIAQYDLPDGMSPGALRHIQRMEYDDRCFAADLVELAVRGAVRIHEEGGTYRLERIANPAADCPAPARELFDAVFAQGKELVLEKGQHERVRAARKAHEAALDKRNAGRYFNTNTKWSVFGALIALASLLAGMFSLGHSGRAAGGWFALVWLAGWSAGLVALLTGVVAAWRNRRGVGTTIAALAITVFAVPFVVGELAGIGLLVTMIGVGFAVVVAALIATSLLFRHLMKAPTVEGRKVLDHVEGLQLYLGTAERDELAAQRAPPLSVGEFQRMLPSALALGVEKTWTDRLATAIGPAAVAAATSAMGWYHATSSGSGIAGLSGSLGSSLSGAISSSSSAPGSSSGGGGGGSSGGGGGGGGGGGW